MGGLLGQGGLQFLEEGLELFGEGIVVFGKEIIQKQGGFVEKGRGGFS